MAKTKPWNHGHVNPSLGLVAELVKRGEQVTYFLTEEFREAIEKTGARFRAYPSGFNLSSIAKAFLSGQEHLEIDTIIQTFQGIETILDAVLGEMGQYDYFNTPQSLSPTVA